MSKCTYARLTVVALVALVLSRCAGGHDVKQGADPSLREDAAPSPRVDVSASGPADIDVGVDARVEQSQVSTVQQTTSINDSWALRLAVAALGVAVVAFIGHMLWEIGRLASRGAWRGALIVAGAPGRVTRVVRSAVARRRLINPRSDNQRWEPRRGQRGQ